MCNFWLYNNNLLKNNLLAYDDDSDKAIISVIIMEITLKLCHVYVRKVCHPHTQPPSLYVSYSYVY